MNPYDLLTIQDASQRVGDLQGRLRLAADTMTTLELRQAITDAADSLDGVDERLTRAYCEHAPQPPQRRKRAA
jgi:hypothetical protein